MKYSCKDKEGSQREFQVEIPSSEVKKRLDDVYDQMNQTLHIPGFRKGRVPRDILERYHEKEAHQSALSDIVSDSYKEALRRSNTRPVGLPKISDIVFKEGKDLSYKATVDVWPKVDIKRYKNIRVKKMSIEVSNKDVEKYLSVLKDTYAEYRIVEDRPARLGDYLVCNVICLVDGRPIYKQKNNISIYLDKDYPIPELVYGLIGAKKDDEREIKVTLPEDKDEPKYSKKEATFKVKVKHIKEKHLPEIDDGFVKTLGRYENVAQLKEAARQDIMRKRELSAREDMSDQILERLLENSTFSPPKGLVEEETERLVKQAKEDGGEHRKTLEKEATRNVRLYFILDEIARIENIEISDAEVEGALGLLAQQSNMSKEGIKKYYIEKDLLGSLRNRLKENKTVEFLINNADIK